MHQRLHRLRLLYCCSCSLRCLPISNRVQNSTELLFSDATRQRKREDREALGSLVSESRIKNTLSTHREIWYRRWSWYPARMRVRTPLLCAKVRRKIAASFLFIVSLLSLSLLASGHWQCVLYILLRFFSIFRCARPTCERLVLCWPFCCNLQKYFCACVRTCVASEQDQEAASESHTQ